MFLAALLVLAQATVPTTTEQAWNIVRGAGYEPEFREKAAFSADLRHDGMTAYAALAMVAGDKKTGIPDTFPYLTVSTELATPDEVDPDDAEHWLKSDLPESKSSFEPHLGRTVTVGRTISLAGNAASDTVRRELDALWSDAKVFAAHYGALFAPAREVDGTTLRFPSDLRLKRADQVSLRRVFRSWGWGSSKRADVAYRGWAEPFEVKGKLLWANAEMNDQKYAPKRFRVERLAEKRQRGNLDIAKLGQGTIYDGAFHEREAFITIDLGSGMTLRDLRRRIEAFADRP